MKKSTVQKRKRVVKVARVSRTDSKHPMAKLKPVDVRYIRAKVAAGKATYAELARKFSVAPTVIRRVANGTSYKDVA